MPTYYRFRPTFGFLSHLYKSTTFQDHKALIPMISRHLPTDGVAIDVGAHGGQVTRLLAGIASNGLVLAVEPSSYSRAILRVALWLRRVRNTVVFAGALGSTNGTATIHTPLKRYRDMGYGLANLVSGGADAISEPVAMVTLDCLVAEFGLKRVDFIKADIEGYEGAMLAGAKSVLDTYRPAVFLEMNDEFLRRAGSSLNGLWSDLKGLGYIPHSVSGAAIANPADALGDVLWIHASRV